MAPSVTNAFIFLAVAIASAIAPVVGSCAEDNVPRVATKGSSSYRIRNHLHAGLVMWGDEITLKSGDGRKSDVVVDLSGYGLGYDFYFVWTQLALGFGIEGLHLSGNAKTLGNQLVFEDRVNSFFPLLAWTQLQISPLKNATAGIGVGAMYYRYRLSRPTSVVTTYDFEYAPQVVLVQKLQLRWLVGRNLTLTHEMLASFGSRLPTGWNISIGYRY